MSARAAWATITAAGLVLAAIGANSAQDSIRAACAFVVVVLTFCAMAAATRAAEGGRHD